VPRTLPAKVPDVFCVKRRFASSSIVPGQARRRAVQRAGGDRDADARRRRDRGARKLTTLVPAPVIVISRAPRCHRNCDREPELSMLALEPMPSRARRRTHRRMPPTFAPLPPYRR